MKKREGPDTSVDQGELTTMAGDTLGEEGKM